ncbi:hypothetical protein [Rubritalea tangerina]|uniref:hypothetical protein n=1 Tax=Rubritalea tangerina TaxID=430798 RepID=UPI0036098AF4
MVVSHPAQHELGGKPHHFTPLYRAKPFHSSYPTPPVPFHRPTPTAHGIPRT